MASRLLPESEGFLPYFLIYAGLSATIHTAVCYLGTPTAALKQFSGRASPPQTGLLARVYGLKNIHTSLIRLYAAYHLDNPQLYDLALCTFVGVLFLYGTELVVYKTVRMREGIFPFVTAGVGLVWMVAQRSWYRVAQQP
ncbi:ergosterol biosynthesis protein-like protein Erg28 [Mycena galopus ATCC 62051]|nr:ergosterol biosynthesis protein-like protein Erg28 [Mycena galopus ATCC 62051]